MQRLEGLAKLTGREQYIDDLPMPPGCLWGMTVRSSSPRGRIKRLQFNKAIDWSKFTVVTHEDIPGPNEVFLIENDQPVLAGSHVRHVHEAVALLAHHDRHLLRQAVREVTAEIELEDPILDFRIKPRPSQVQRGSDNVLKKLLIDKGDVESALAAAPHVIEGIYESGAQEHIYIENQGMLAWVEDGVVIVKGSMQCPYYVVNALKHALNRSEKQVRVIQSPTGGGFGGKEDYPSTIALHAALLAMKSGRPVKIIYDRGEDMAATTKRHPAWIRHRTGVDHHGRLLAQDIEVVLDGGAYVTLSPVVLSRGMIHAAGPYSCDHVRIAGRAMLTNAVPFGAFRGFGAPQTLFACERHMDVIARQLEIDPIELRRINLLRDGQTTSTGQIITGKTDRVALLDKAVATSDYKRRQSQHASFNLTHPYLRRGMGLVCFYHGAGFTGSGEVYLASRLEVNARPDGRIEILSASTEMGQGTVTVFTQLAAGRLGYKPEDVIVTEPDTSRVPNSGPTVASRTAMVVGKLLEKACDDLRTNIDADESLKGNALKAAIVRWHHEHPGKQLRGRAHYEPPPGIRWDDSTYQGDAYATFSWATYVAEVEVDLRTYLARVTDFHAVQEVGTVLNETLARGQIQGGVVQGIGWALMEECVWHEGAMKNSQLTNYIIPTSDDVPQIQVYFDQVPYEHGAHGAKGLGELPMDGPAPAIANAVAAATGADPRTIPLTPERLMNLLSSLAMSRAS